jgi:hypothetical protein
MLRVGGRVGRVWSRGNDDFGNCLAIEGVLESVGVALEGIFGEARFN